MTEEKKDVPEKKLENEKKGNSLSDKVADKVYQKFTESDKKNKKKKTKKLKPRKAKLSKGKKRKGYIAVMKIHENHHVDFQRVPVEESAYKLSEDTFHALENGDVFFYNGKYPMVIQATTKKNPYNPLKGYNETKGQKHIMNLMSKHAIKEGKKKMGSVLLYLALGVGAVILVSKLLGG